MAYLGQRTFASFEKKARGWGALFEEDEDLYSDQNFDSQMGMFGEDEVKDNTKEKKKEDEELSNNEFMFLGVKRTMRREGDQHLYLSPFTKEEAEPFSETSIDINGYPKVTHNDKEQSIASVMLNIMDPEPGGSFTAHYLNAEDVEVQSVIHTYNPKKSSLEDDGTVDNAKDKEKNTSKVDSSPKDNTRIVYEKSDENKHQYNNTGYIFRRANGEPITDASEVRKFIMQQKQSKDPEISKQFKEDFPVAQKGTSTEFNAPTMDIEGYEYKFYSMLSDPTWGMEEEEPLIEKPTNNADFIGSYVDNRPAKVNAPNGVILHDTPDNNDQLYNQIKRSDFKEVFLLKKGSKLEIIAKSNKDNPGWVMVRDEDNKVGWIEDRYVSETESTDVLSHYTAGLYRIKKDDELASILISQVPNKDLFSSGIQNFAFAFKLLNEGNSGLYFEPITEDLHNYVITYGEEEVALEDADVSQMFNSIKLYEGGLVRIPTKAFVEQAKADGLIKQATSDREVFLNLIKYGDTFLEGVYDGFVTAAEDLVQGIWDFVKSLFTGEIFGQLKEMWDFVSTASWGQIKELFTGAVDDFKSKWFNPNMDERWHYRGEVIGQILFEIVIAIFTGGGAILAKMGQGTKLSKMVTKLNKGVKGLSPKVPSNVRKQLDKFSANRKNGPIELKSKKDSSFVPVKDTDETIKEAFDRKKKKFEEQFEKDLQDEASDLIKDRAAALKRYKDKGGKMSQSKWEIKYNTLYKNRKIGKIGEDTFKDFMDGYKPPKSYKSTGGKDRYIDNFKPNTKTAREIKTGKVNDTKSIRAQIEKDLDILANKDITEIQKIEWHFLDGLDPKLEDRLIEIKRIIGNDKFDYIDYTKNK